MGVVPSGQVDFEADDLRKEPVVYPSFSRTAFIDNQMDVVAGEHQQMSTGARRAQSQFDPRPRRATCVALDANIAAQGCSRTGDRAPWRAQSAESRECIHGQ